MYGSPTFCVRRVAGIRIRGKLGSVDTGMRGRELTMAVTSAKKVVNASWVSCRGATAISIESSIRLARPIIRSQLPPMCEAWGGSNTHVHSLLLKNCIAWLSQRLELIPSSLQVPKKFVPQSDLNCFTGPRMDRNRRSALMKLEDSCS